MRWRVLSSLKLAPEDQTAVQRVLGQIDEIGCEPTVLLMGSAARGSMTLRSDIDLLVITSNPLNRILTPPRIHLHPKTRADFLKSLRDGDELVSWAVRFAAPLRDSTGWWQEVSKSRTSWPDWRQKLVHIAKRLRTAQIAIKDGDKDASEEELVMAASHCGRAILLQVESFPLSRPELPMQLSQVGEQALSDILSRLMQGGVNLDEMKKMFAMLRKLHRRLRLKAALKQRTGGRDP